jgi:hypothetical protein
MDEPLEQFQSCAAAARAAGGAGDAGAFEWAWRAAWDAAARFDESRMRSAALVDLGRGAASLARWTDAVRAFDQARAVAARRGEAGVLVTAEAGLMAAPSERSPDTPARPQRRTGGLRGDLVAREMIDALQPLRTVAA